MPFKKTNEKGLGEFGFKTEEPTEMKAFQTARGPLEHVAARKPTPQTPLVPPTGGLVPYIEVGRVEPLAPPEPPKPSVAAYVNPLYRLRKELEKRGFTMTKAAAKRETTETLTEDWKGVVYRKGDMRAWIAPVGRLDKKGQPVMGKWSGYVSVGLRSFSSGWKDGLDAAVDALLVTVDRHSAPTPPTTTTEAKPERQQKEPTASVKPESVAEVKLRWGGTPRGLRVLESQILVDGNLRMSGHSEFRPRTREKLREEIEDLVKSGVDESTSVYATKSYTVTPSIDEIVRTAPADVLLPETTEPAATRESLKKAMTGYMESAEPTMAPTGEVSGAFKKALAEFAASLRATLSRLNTRIAMRPTLGTLDLRQETQKLIQDYNVNIQPRWKGIAFMSTEEPEHIRVDLSHLVSIDLHDAEFNLVNDPQEAKQNIEEALDLMDGLLGGRFYLTPREKKTGPEEPRQIPEFPPIPPGLKFSPRQFGYEFMPPHEHPEQFEGFLDITGEDVNVPVELEIGWVPSSKKTDNGKPGAIALVGHPAPPALDPAFSIGTMSNLGTDFTPDEAKAALEFIAGGAKAVDYYFHEIRARGSTDEEYAETIKGLGLPLTKGQYRFTWDPSKVEVPEWLKILAEAKSKDEVEALRNELRLGYRLSVAEWQKKQQRTTEEKKAQGQLTPVEPKEQGQLTMAESGATSTTTGSISPDIKEAISSILGEYVQRNMKEIETATGGYNSLGDDDLEVFMQLYKGQIEREALTIGPRGTEPSGQWKEKWRPFVKSVFDKWLKNSFIPDHKK